MINKYNFIFKPVFSIWWLISSMKVMKTKIQVNISKILPARQKTSNMGCECHYKDIWMKQ